MKNYDKLIHEAYVEIYALSTPQADFNELLLNAKTDSNGKKVIDFMNYTIKEGDYNAVMNKLSSKYKLNKLEKRKFNTTMLLGATPVFSKPYNLK